MLCPNFAIPSHLSAIALGIISVRCFSWVFSLPSQSFGTTLSAKMAIYDDKISDFAPSLGLIQGLAVGNELRLFPLSSLVGVAPLNFGDNAVVNSINYVISH